MSIISPGRCPECDHETVHDERGCLHAGTYQRTDLSWDLRGIEDFCLCSLRNRPNPRYSDVVRFGLDRARSLAKGRLRRRKGQMIGTLQGVPVVVVHGGSGADGGR